MQKERSDIALDEFEKNYSPRNNSQTAAFEELKKLGVYTSDEQYNPEKAEHEFYTNRLQRIRKSRGLDSQGRSAKLKLIDQYADRVIKTEKDITRQIELLKLWTQRDLNYSISSSFAFRIICKAQGTKLGISEPVTSDLEIDITEDPMFGVRY